MSNCKIFLLTIFVMLGFIPAAGQTMNKLSIPEIIVPQGTQAQMPIKLDNTDGIVAIQFDLVMPSEITIGEGVTMTNRCGDHISIVKDMGNNLYRFLSYSPSNALFLGNSGNIFFLNVDVSAYCIEGTTYKVQLDNVILSKKDGTNGLTAQENGMVKIVKARICCRRS